MIKGSIPEEDVTVVNIFVPNMGFFCSLVSKESACNSGDLSLIPGLEDSLEKEMATHSSILAWRIPGMGEPGGLPSMGSHGVGHD